MKGTVWQRCTVCSRKVNGRDAKARHRGTDCDGTSGTWAYKVDLGRAAGGKRQQRVRGGFDTETDAQRALRELLHKIDRQDYVEPSARTVRGFLVEEWLPAIRANVAGGTFRKRRRHVERYVVPTLGGVKLQEVTAAALEQLYGRLGTEGASRGPLAASTVADAHRTLHKAFEDAIRWGYLSRNPAKAAEPPSQASVKADARAALRVWTPEQLRAFIDATTDHAYGTAFTLAAMTGARRSELLAVRWEDVDLDAARITFGRAAVLDADGVLELRDSTKSSTSSRTIALDPQTVVRLRSHRVAQAEQRLRAGSAWHHLDLVLCRADGSPLSPAAMSLAFRRANDRHQGLPRVRLHDLRHTHATILLQNGVPVRTVAQRLGHASATITMDVYSHVMPGDDDAAATRFASLVGGSSP